MLLMTAGWHALFAQRVEITGTVTSAEDGASLPGAAIVVKGTTIGSITNLDGEYTISVPEDEEILVYSFIGLKTQEISINGRTEIDVVLEPDIVGLDEVVVTAMGIRKETKALGYSIQKVEGKKLAAAKQMDVSKALQGKVAGVVVRQSSGMPGATSFITIRGSSSITGENQPLYVVDGMPLASDKAFSEPVGKGTNPSARILDLNPDDIESINVLKGATASALYGLRAANGVVVITTKSGSAARDAGKKTLVTLNSSYTFDQITRLPDLQSTYAQGNDGKLDLYSSGSWGPGIDTLQPYMPQRDNLFYDYPDYDPAHADDLQEPGIYNNQEDFFKAGYTFNNSADISTSSENTTYSLGFGRTDQKGIIETTGMQRSSAKFNSNFNLSEKWSASASVNYTNVNVDKVPGGSNLANPLFTVYFCPRTYDLTNKPFEEEGNPYIQRHYRFSMDNPYWALKHNDYWEKTDRLFGNTNITYSPWDWLTVGYRLGLDKFTTTGKEVVSLGSGAGRAYPEFAPYWGEAWGIPTGGSIEDYTYQRTELNSNFSLTIDKSITSDIGFSAVLGNESYDIKTHLHDLIGNGITIGGFDNISNTSEQNVGQSDTHQRVIGFYGTATLNYQSLLYLTLTGRNDFVSNMPRDHRSYFYPSVSLGLVFTEMPFLEDNPVLPFGKLRTSFAQVGQAGALYATRNVFIEAAHENGFLTGVFNFPYQGYSAFSQSTTLFSDALRPMNTKTFEIGLDLRFVDRRIGIDYSFYNIVSEDQIFLVPLASSTGFRNEYRNSGKMENTGHELVLNLVPVKTSEFSWNITTNFTTYRNRVVELAEGVERIQVGYQNFASVGTYAYAGEPYPVIFGSTFLRDDEGNMVVDSREIVGGSSNPFYGMPLAGPEDVIAKVSPDWETTLINSFNYKGLSLSVQFDIREGSHMSSGLNRLLRNYGADAITEDREEWVVLDAVKGYRDASGDLVLEGGNDIQIQKNEDYWATVMWNITESAVFETSFVRLREVVLNYELPADWFGNIFMNSASVFLTGRNLWLSTDFPNFDPEVSTSSGNGIGGFEYVSLPNTKSFGGGLRITF